MSKTARLMVRIEPEYQDALSRIANQLRPPSTVSALIRLATVEYIERHTEAAPQPPTGPTETK